ncbi:MAG TPA: HAD-IA family hydrolase [Acidimicrobiia bacterium]
MAAIDAVLLDVGGVFYLPDHDRIESALRRAEVAVDVGDLDRAHYAGAAALETFMEGDRSIWEAYNRAYARVCGVADDALDGAVEALLSEFATHGLWTRIVPGAPEGLRALGQLDIALGIISNADGTVEEQLRADGICQIGPGPGVEVAAVLDSTVVGVAKPDPRIFELALDALGLRPDQAIYVGDTPAGDVVGARAAGIRPVLVDPYDFHPDLDVERVRSLADVVDLVVGARVV